MITLKLINIFTVLQVSILDENQQTKTDDTDDIFQVELFVRIKFTYNFSGDTLKDILTALNLPCDSNDLMQGYKDFLPILDNHNQNANTSVSLANRIYVNDK